LLRLLGQLGDVLTSKGLLTKIEDTRESHEYREKPFTLQGGRVSVEGIIPTPSVTNQTNMGRGKKTTANKASSWDGE